MTVTATSYTPLSYNGNGSTSVFNITFQFYEVAVIHIDSSGSETEWTENTHYTVTGGEGSTGSITVITTVPATGEKLRIERRTSKDQPRDYDLDNAVLEAALQQSDDRLAMIMQELVYNNNRRPAIAVADYTTPIEFPAPSASKALGWNAAGDALQNIALVDLDGEPISTLSTVSTLAAGDLFVLYDNSSGDNAAITWANVKTAVETALNLGTLAALDEIPDGSVTTAKLANDAVGNEHIEVGSVTTTKLANDAVVSSKIADDAVGSEHIEANVILDNPTLNGAVTVPGSLAAGNINSGSIIIADDAVGNITPPVNGGIIFITAQSGAYPQTIHMGAVAYDLEPASYLHTIFSGNTFSNGGDTALSGTTGTDGYTTISARDGYLQIENRAGVTITYTYFIIG